MIFRAASLSGGGAGLAAGAALIINA